MWHKFSLHEMNSSHICFPFFFRGRDLLVVLLCFYGAFQDTVCIIDAREDYNETDK